MVKYPDVQAKAQAELDTVIGKGRLPAFEDENSLPYLMAIIKETLRWRPVVPIAIPHLLIQDDIYRGYTLPANAIIVPNSWQVRIIVT